MRKVPLEEVQDGMVLAVPLTGSAGNILMGQGIPLRSAIIPRLAAWGVTYVVVEGDPTPEELNLIAEEGKASASLEKMFAGKTVNPGMETLFQCLLRHRRRHAH